MRVYGWLCLLVLGLFPAESLARGIIFPWWHARTSYYYYPVFYPVWESYSVPIPMYVVPAAPACVPSQPAANFAAPRPAGPSTGPMPRQATSEPPLRPQPIVTEKPNTSAAGPGFYDVYASGQPAGRHVEEKHGVGFWNLSQRDLTLKVAGQTYSLRRGESLRLQLADEFTWQVDQREAQVQRIAPGESSLEIVIRR
ncbi:MAG: hypothetical protein KatS3mg105_1802 [Gemmatales bacterium]|nr:MAG: hypothetical protein KatS3mg105_1802 [Gemmatales bacterium]